MITRRAYIVLLFTTVLVLSACGRDRRHRARHHLTTETEVTPSSPKGHGEDASSATEIWSEEVFELLAPAMPGYVPSQILERFGYITSYNHETKCPNWVAWHLTKDHTRGNHQRAQEVFSEDEDVRLPRATDQDYYNSRYDRGHMCPAGDNKWSQEAMTQSFLFTNICPQNHGLNKYEWNDLEILCRDWARKYGAVDIVCGPLYGKPETQKTIGKNKVWVPDAFFKVILCRRGTPKAIGFVYRNEGRKQVMEEAVRTVDEVERLTGIDFFPSLEDETERKVEAEARLSDW